MPQHCRMLNIENEKTYINICTKFRKIPNSDGAKDTERGGRGHRPRHGEGERLELTCTGNELLQLLAFFRRRLAQPS